MRSCLSATYKCKALSLLSLSPMPFWAHTHFMLWKDTLYSPWSNVLGSFWGDSLGQMSMLPFWHAGPSATCKIGMIYVNVPFITSWTDLIWNTPCDGIRTLYLFYLFLELRVSQVAQWERTLCQCRRCKRYGFDPWVRKMPWRKKWQPALVFLPGKFHGQREPGGLQSLGSQRVRHDWVTEHTLLNLM